MKVGPSLYLHEGAGGNLQTLTHWQSTGAFGGKLHRRSLSSGPTLAQPRTANSKVKVPIWKMFVVTTQRVKGALFKLLTKKPSETGITVFKTSAEFRKSVEAKCVNSNWQIKVNRNITYFLGPIWNARAKDISLIVIEREEQVNPLYSGVKSSCTALKTVLISKFEHILHSLLQKPRDWLNYAHCLVDRPRQFPNPEGVLTDFT